MKIATYVILALATLLMQGLFLPAILQYRWQPDIILVWVVLITLLRGRKAGVIWAVLGGITRDVVLGNYFGIHFFPYLLIAYGLGTIHENRFDIQATYAAVTVAVMTVFDGVIRLVMLMVAKADISIFSYMWYQVWPNIWLNALIAFLIYRILRMLEEKDEYIW